jgi:hypothetical protein
MVEVVHGESSVEGGNRMGRGGGDEWEEFQWRVFFRGTPSLQGN